MAEKDFPCNRSLNTNITPTNERNLASYGVLDPPLIVISDSETDVEVSEAIHLGFSQDTSLQKANDLECLLQCSSAASSPWQHYQENDTSLEGCNNLLFEGEMPASSTLLPNIFNEVEGQQNKTISEVSWEEYKSLLLRVWEEKSLEGLFTNKKSSSSAVPPGSNISEVEVPYAIDLLSECESQTLQDKSNQKNTSSNIGATSLIENQTSHSQTSKQKQQQQNSSTIKSRLLPFVGKTSQPLQPLPLFNSAKGMTSKAQGEAREGPTLFLRSNASLQPQEEEQQEEGGGIRENSPSRRACLLPKMPFNFLIKREQHHKRQQTPSSPPTEDNQNQNYLLPNNTRNKEETLPRKKTSPSLPQPAFHNSDPPPFRSCFGRDNEQTKTNCSGSEVCYYGNEIQNLKFELGKAQNSIENLSYKMSDQSSHLEQLIKKRNVLGEKLNEFIRTSPHQFIPRMSYPLFTQQGFKTPHPAMYPPGLEAYTCAPHQALGRRASWQYPYDIPRSRMTGGYKNRPEEFMSQLAGSDPRAFEDLRDRIVALQVQNIELNLFLKKEEMRRKEAEEEVKKEKEYVRKLQESIQDISSSTLIIDPLTYKKVADNYIAAKKKPVRRTHTCNPYIGSSDLVCDSNRLKVVQNKNQSTSCPSSPLGSAHERKSSNLNASIVSSSVPTGSGTGEPFSGSSSDCILFSLDKGSTSEVHDPNLSWNVESQNSPSTLNSRQYQELLSNLDNLQVSSSPS